MKNESEGVVVLICKSQFKIVIIMYLMLLFTQIKKLLVENECCHGYEHTHPCY